MNDKLSLAVQQPFGNTVCDFWVDNNRNEILMTRDQIGTALEYVNPQVAITKIHSRNKERLDKYSTCTKLVTVEGGRNVERENFLYSAKGVYEICRWSRQPKADAFMDFVWDVVDGLRTGAVQFNNINGIIEQKLNTFKISMVKDMKNAVMQTFLKLQGIQSMFDTYDWKQRVNSKITNVCECLDEDRNSVLSKVYTKMKSEYGVDLNKISNMYDDIGFTHSSAFYMVMHHEYTRNLFEKIVDHMMFETLPMCGYTLDDDTNYEPAFETAAFIDDPITAIIRPLAVKLDDKSIGFGSTKRKVYKKMGVDWKNRATRYKNTYKIKRTPTKPELINEVPVLQKKFKNTVKTMIRELED